MNVHDWHRNGLQPAFATVEQWISDQLGYIGAEDEACYAVQVRDENAPGGLTIRILVATDKGLVDMTWQRPESVESRNLASRHYRWEDVRGLRLTAATRLEPTTLIHREPEWGLEIDDPAFTLERAEEGLALLDFWKACDSEMKKAS